MPPLVLLYCQAFIVCAMIDSFDVSVVNVLKEFALL
jgi:hypothetical protein